MKRKRKRDDDFVEKMKGSIEAQQALLARIEYHAAKIREEGGEPSSSPEWIESQRRRLARELGRLGA